MLKKLILKNFRSYFSAEIDINDQNLILVGENGKGKTTILEATLFAITNKQLKGKKENLLKKGEKEFYVKLELEFNSKLFKIKNGGIKKGRGIKSESSLKIFDNNNKLLKEANSTENVYSILNEELISPKIFDDLILQNKLTSFMESTTSKRIELFDSLTIGQYQFKEKLDLIKKINKNLKPKVDPEFIENQITELNNNIDQINNNTQSIINEIKQKNVEKEDIQDKLDTLLEKETKGKNIITKIRNNLDVLYKKQKFVNEVINLDNQIKNNKELVKQKEDINNKINEINNQILDKNTIKTELIKHTNKIGKEILIYLEKKEAIKKKNLKKLKEDKQSIEEKIFKIQQEINTKETKIKTRYEELEKNENDIVNKIEELENKITDINEKIKKGNNKLKHTEEILKQTSPDSAEFLKIFEIKDINRFLSLDKCPICGNENIDKKHLENLIDNKYSIIKNKIETIKNKIQKLEIIKEETNKQLENIRNQLNNVQNEKEKLIKQLENTNKNIIENKKEIKSLKEKIKNIDIKIDKIKEAIYKYQNKISEINEKITENTNIKVDEIDINTFDFKLYYKDFKEKKNQIQELEKQISNLEHTLHPLNEQLKHIERQIEENQKIKTKIDKMLSHNNFNISAISPNLLEDIDQQIDTLKVKEEENNKKLDALSIKIIETKDKLNSIVNEIKILKRDIEVNEKTMQDIQNKIKDYQKQLDEDKKIIKAKKSLDKLEDILDKKNLPSILRKEILKVINIKFRQLHNIFGFDFIPEIDENISFKEWNELSGAQELTFSLSLIYTLKEILVPYFNLFIIDEPTNRMDAKRVILLKEFLTNLANTDVQLIIATHNQNLIDIPNAKIIDVSLVKN